MCFGDTLQEFFTTARRRAVIGPALQAELEAEMAANQRTAQVRKRRRSSTLFGAGNRVLGSPATTPGTPASVMGSGGGGRRTGGGDGGGARGGGGGSYAVP